MSDFGKQEKIEWAKKQKERIFCMHENELISTDEFIEQLKIYNNVIEKWGLGEMVELHKCIKQ